jgi:2-C-methyl-D-erythritol 2,4-cyclodiphosphate synthase
VIERCLASARTTGTGVAALSVHETLKRAPGARVDSGLDRTDVWSMQTPQAFQLGILRRAHERAAQEGFSGTDEVSLVERLGLLDGVHLVEGARENVKITCQEDLAFAEAWLGRARQMRIGTVYDIHRLAPGRQLWLGGVHIEHDSGLSGHSDADVVLHAICDALLGAAGLPDIGQLYPNTDDRFAGASSIEFVKDVRVRLIQSGWRPVNVDCTLIAERPKIAPYTATMRQTIAAALDLPVDAVNVKATTNEGIGSLGAGEGIACQAVATVTSYENTEKFRL